MQCRSQIGAPRDVVICSVKGRAPSPNTACNSVLVAPINSFGVESLLHQPDAESISDSGVGAACGDGFAVGGDGRFLVSVFLGTVSGILGQDGERGCVILARCQGLQLDA